MKRLIKKSSLDNWGISLNDLKKNTIEVVPGYKLDDSIKDKINDAYNLYDLLKSIPELTDVLSYKIDVLQNVYDTIDTKYFMNDVKIIKDNIINVITCHKESKKLFNIYKNILNNFTEDQKEEATKAWQKSFEEYTNMNEQTTYEFSKIQGWYIINLYKNKDINITKDLYCDDESIKDQLYNQDINLIDFLRTLKQINNGEKKSYGTEVYLQKYIFPQYMGEDWNIYKNLIESYVVTSDPTKISEIENIVNKYPELKEILDYLCDKTLYRGMSFNYEEDYNNMINNDNLFRNGYASGTSDYNQAKKFADKSNFGIIYKCSTNDVIYTWQLLSGQYSEKENIFNTNTAEILDKEIINNKKDEY